MSYRYVITRMASMSFNLDIDTIVNPDKALLPYYHSVARCADSLNIPYRYDCETTEHIGDAEGVPYYSHVVYLVVDDDDDAMLLKLAWEKNDSFPPLV